MPPSSIHKRAPSIAIDGYNLAIPRGTGVATYARSLSRCLHGLGHPIDILYGLDIDRTADPTEREVDLFDQLQTERGFKRAKYPSLAWARDMMRAGRGETAIPILVSGRVESKAVADRLPAFDRLWNIRHLFGLSAHYFRNFGRFMTVRLPDPPAIMHWTYPVPVHMAGARNIYTIHDLVPLRLPYATLDHKPTHMRLLRECLRRADHVCTVSERSRDDLLGFFPETAPERVTNTYQAVVPPSAMLPQAELDATLRGAFGLEPRGYFLFCGSIEPKKNVGRLLQAYLSSGLELPLVIVSARAWNAEGELSLLRDRAPGDRRVRQIEYVPSDMLATLVRGARAVTFPSLYEGFGLPVLEAMQFGTPVLTSREGSLPEVAGDAALYVDAYDPSDIAVGLRRLAEDDALCARLSALGTTQAALFGMDRYEVRMRNLYDRVLNGPLPC